MPMFGPKQKFFEPETSENQTFGTKVINFWMKVRKKVQRATWELVNWESESYVIVGFHFVLKAISEILILNFDSTEWRMISNSSDY